MDMIEYLEMQQYQFSAIAERFPIIAELHGVEQNPNWHSEGDVFIHTRNVCDAVITLPEWKTLNQEERGLLYLAALFHDIGKKSCSRIEHGVITSPKHAVIGARMFREYWYRNQEYASGLSWNQRETVVSLIRFHGLPPLFMEKNNMDQYLLKAREMAPYPLLYLLAKADLLGRECRDQKVLLEMVDYFREYVLELGCYFDKWDFANEFTKNRYYQGTNVRADEALYDTAEFTVYLMSGLPLAGKDTYIIKMLSELPMISLDEIRQEMSLKPGKGSAAVAAEAKERARQLLRKKQAFVWNATNLLFDTRSKLCRLFEAYGARVQIIYLEQPYNVLLERNQKRDRYIPLPVLERMITKLEIPEPWETYRVIYDLSVRI
ncbi:MAG: AAA family ATPase [Lachnospiraceae bacterium]